uniref:Tyrosinase copper-binding domain-containing protein n=1 Tax=Anopheles farauti TaxID=69004 RepID=A0A182QSW5_9DIPT
MSTIQSKFSGLLQHPYEPLFLPKNNGQLVYDLPDSFFTDRYRPIEENLINRFGMAVDIPMNYTASDAVLEQRVAYFREDIGVNLHHWHWHLVYPGEGPASVVRKDRRGELFYYMHQQMLARYQTERYSQGLSRVEPLDNLRAPIPEAYYPKIIRSANNRTYPARYPNMTLSDVARTAENFNFAISDLEKQLQRVVEAIDAGFVVSPTGQRTPLDNFSGVDVLGDIIESSTISVNRELYGDTHNIGHILLCFIHDPRGEFLESFGVMGDVATAMRDPIFYRWHTYVDNLFQRHKLRFSPYTKVDLSNPGVNLLSLETELNRHASVKNRLLTFWQRSQVDLGAGLDFGPDGNVYVTFTHLQHAAFNYRLQVAYSGTARPATVRIFLAPKRNEKGVALTFEEQRRLVIEMDRFKVNLTPGINNIIRRSTNSSVTIPYERTFRNVSQTNLGDASFRFCGCGFPAHMLVPKGDTVGVQYDLFAMLSDYNKDKVDPPFDENAGCNDAHSFCGLQNRSYPDARNMGFPFDRRAPNTVKSFADFVAPYQNMRLATVTVQFTNTVVART